MIEVGLFRANVRANIDQPLMPPHPLETAQIVNETPWVRAECRRFEHPAMATTFEIYIFEREAHEADLAVVAAFELIDQLEEELSYFIASSDISRINRLTAGQSTRVGVATMDCLELARQVYDRTGGAFDPTIGALLTGRRRWSEEPGADRFMGALDGNKDAEDQPAHVGMELIETNRDLMAVGVLTDHVRVDLGGIGKGYALDQAAALLRDWGVACAMLSAGRSTMLPIGGPPERSVARSAQRGGDDAPGGPRDRDAWVMRVLDPRDEQTELGCFDVTDQAVSVSAASAAQPHILDPTSGEPVSRCLGAWALASSAAEADALSTALMVMPPQAIRSASRDPNASVMILHEVRPGCVDLEISGLWKRLCCELRR